MDDGGGFDPEAQELRHHRGFTVEQFQDAGRRERHRAGHGVGEDEFLLHTKGECVTLQPQESRVHGPAPSLGRTANPHAGPAPPEARNAMAMTKRWAAVPST